MGLTSPTPTRAGPSSGRDPDTHSLRAPPPAVPTIQPGPAAVNASVNQTALLPCQVDGTPPPLVSWRKDGAPLDPASPRWDRDRKGLGGGL